MNNLLIDTELKGVGISFIVLRDPFNPESWWKIVKRNHHLNTCRFRLIKLEGGEEVGIRESAHKPAGPPLTEEHLAHHWRHS